MINKNFQEQLKYYRKGRALTQDQLGEILGVSGQTIYKYENGVTFPPADTLEKILNYFKIDPNTLFKYESKTDDYLQEIKNMIENHKRLYFELSYLKAHGIKAPIDEIIQEESPNYTGVLDQEMVLDFQHYLLLRRIEAIIIELERESTKSGNFLRTDENDDDK